MGACPPHDRLGFMSQETKTGYPDPVKHNGFSLSKFLSKNLTSVRSAGHVSWYLISNAIRNIDKNMALFLMTGQIES